MDVHLGGQAQLLLQQLRRIQPAVRGNRAAAGARAGAGGGAGRTKRSARVSSLWVSQLSSSSMMVLPALGLQLFTGSSSSSKHRNAPASESVVTTATPSHMRAAPRIGGARKAAPRPASTERLLPNGCQSPAKASRDVVPVRR